MLAAGLPRLPGVRPGNHRLGFQCFFLEGYRHFRQHHPDEVAVHIHLGNRAVLLPDQHGKPHSLLRRGLYSLRRCFRRCLRRSIRLARRNAQHDPRHHQTHDGGDQNILCQCSHWYPPRRYGSTAGGKNAVRTYAKECSPQTKSADCIRGLGTREKQFNDSYCGRHRTRHSRRSCRRRRTFPVFCRVPCCG